MNAKCELKIDGKILEVKESAKFLGVVLDRRLTWNEQVTHIENKCKSRLNLLRSVAGNTWGASKEVLITMYKALIRPIIDYGCIVYDTAAVTQLNRLNIIQNKAMKIACGTFIGTAIEALEVDCGLLPLKFHRLRYQINFAFKILSSDNHVSRSVMSDHWTLHYGNYAHNSDPFYKRVQPHVGTLQLNVKAPQHGNVHPWLYTCPEADTSLAQEVSKRESAEILKALAMEKVEMYSNYTQVYTDASKLTDGRVGIGIFFPQDKLHISERVTDNVSIYAGELVAIKRAIEIYKTNIHQTTVNTTSLAIFSDSLSAITSLRKAECSSRPNLLTEIMELVTSIQSQLTLIWVPSHVGIIGNETADKLAVAGTSLSTIDNNVQLELSEAKCQVAIYIERCWQKDWQVSNSFYRQLVPVTSQIIKYHNKTRKKETVITRLRLGKCRLNYYLHKIGKHPDGKCSTCNVPETIEHYLLYCKNEVTEQVKKVCIQLDIQPQLHTILNNNTILNTIFNHSDRQL
jgi:ribonuclease HI